MNFIEEYLKQELKQGQEKIKQEFSGQSKEIEGLWKEKIDMVKKECKDRVRQAKEMFIKNTREKVEQNFYRLINEKRAALRTDFSIQAQSFLKKLDLTTKATINHCLITVFKKKFGGNLRGIFKANKETTVILKQSFPFAEICQSDEISLGFYYTDDNIEVDMTEKSITQKYTGKI